MSETVLGVDNAKSGICYIYVCMYVWYVCMVCMYGIYASQTHAWVLFFSPKHGFLILIPDSSDTTALTNLAQNCERTPAKTLVC